MSEISFGGVEIGMPYGIGVKGNTGTIAEQDAIVLLQAAMDSGINLFDTARLYGSSESIMGKAFRGKRKDIIISTKCAHLLDPDGSIPGYGRLQNTIVTSLKESLTALKTDYIDVFSIHNATAEMLDNEDISNIFASLKKSGVIRSAGVSTYTFEEAEKVISGGNWEVIQLPFNLMDQRQGALFPIAAEKGIGIVVRSILLKGILTTQRYPLHPALHSVESHLKQYDQLLRIDVPDLTTLAIKFGLSFGAISTILVGLDKLEYLDRLQDIANGVYLDNETFSKAKTLGYPDADFLNLPKWDRMGWLS
ncbi:MAG: aldo/keto reductase [Chitinophagaceae bacterium]|nr:aldo/keto reductase [Chitinophagaceae bacterium]